MDTERFLGKSIEKVSREFVAGRRLLTFTEYLRQFCEAPSLLGRNAAQYLLGAIEHFGETKVAGLGIQQRRFLLFDAPFDGGRDRLLGQESVQEEFVQALRNLVREGRGNRLLLLHGPNGSAKTSFVQGLARAMVHYSSTPQGAVYTFNWVFPKSSYQSKQVGFMEKPQAGKLPDDSYAKLDEGQIGARLPAEMRDHPILVLPKELRRELLEGLEAELGGDSFRFSRALLDGDLSPVSRKIFDTLLVSYGGDLARVLAHVQVERFEFSRRYRQGIVTVEPQMHVDAHARQLTMDESFAQLPPVLRHVPLFMLTGDLVDAHRGLIEFSDLLKRPLDAFKYLLGTCENSRVTVDGLIIYLDAVFIGTANDKYVSAFTKAADFASFKGRTEFITVPYLRNYLTEEQIYSSQLGDTVMGKHAAPHAYAVAAQWAVLTRMRRPRPELYPEGVKEAVAGLNPMEKADLYALGLAPAEARFEVAKALEQSIEALAAEYSDQLDYEGDTGASAREIRTALLNAAQLPDQECLTPVAVLGELGDLSRQTALYEFLHVQSDNGYGDAENLLRLVAQRYASTLDREFRAAMGLVTEGEFERLLQRYAAHASAWLKGESVSEGPGKPAGKPDEQYMRGLEERWGRSGEAAATRQEFMGRIASFGLEHPGVALPYGRIFREQIELLARSYYAENRPEVESRLMSVLEMLHGGAVEEADRAQNLAVIEAMKSRYGYCDHCLVSALGYLASLLRE